MADINQLTTTLTECGRWADHIDELTAVALARVAGAPIVDRVEVATTLDTIPIEVKTLRARLNRLRLDLPIH